MASSSATTLYAGSATRWPIFKQPLPAYASAVGLTAILFLARWNLDSMLGNNSRMVFFLIAAALSAFLFGRGPGIASTFIGVVAGDYFFTAPRYSFHLHSAATMISVVMALAQGVLISICAGYLHRALQLRADAEAEARNLYEAERRAHEASEESNRMKDYFMAVLSHELRGPLGAISYCVSDRLKDAAMPAEVREDFALIDRNARMQSRLIEDLLDLTRLTRGKMEIELRQLDVHLLLAEAVRTSDMGGLQVGPTPALHLNASETRIQGDRDRLLQVFWNILRNAAKFTPADGRIDVETFDTASGRIAIRIRDTGVGLTSDAFERVFHPFEQASRETNKKHGGLGLGLAIARGLIELHDGTLIGESAGPGKGTTFTIDLPVASRDAAQTIVRHAASEPAVLSNAAVTLS